MIGQTVSHYQILGKLGEVPKLPASVSQRIEKLGRLVTSVSPKGKNIPTEGNALGHTTDQT
jgi:hypothetical protein